MAAIGVNTVRIYSFDPERGTHAAFFDACLRNNITVIGGFELSASHYDFSDPVSVREAKRDLEDQLDKVVWHDGAVHPAVRIYQFPCVPSQHKMRIQAPLVCPWEGHARAVPFVA